MLPEKWNAIGDAAVYHATAESIEGGESVTAMSGWARAHGITLVGGSIAESREGRDKLSNTSLVFDPEGQVVATYRAKYQCTFLHRRCNEKNGHDLQNTFFQFQGTGYRDDLNKIRR